MRQRGDDIFIFHNAAMNKIDKPRGHGMGNSHWQNDIKSTHDVRWILKITLKPKTQKILTITLNHNKNHNQIIRLSHKKNNYPSRRAPERLRGGNRLISGRAITDPNAVPNKTEHGRYRMLFSVASVFFSHKLPVPSTQIFCCIFRLRFHPPQAW